MSQHDTIRELIEAAVAESFDEHLRALHDEIVNRVMQTVAPSLEVASRDLSARDLNAVVAAVQSASQQVEILKMLLEGASEFSARTALFILRGNLAVGWQARGFADNDAIKAVMMDTGTGAVSRAIHDYATTITPMSGFDSKFDSSMGAPLDGKCVLVPLIVRGKVAALLYADAGDEGISADVPALELLAHAAGDWIELQALRKATGAPAHYPTPTRAPASAPASIAPPPHVAAASAAAQASVDHSSSVAVPLAAPVPTQTPAQTATPTTNAAPPAPEEPPVAPQVATSVRAPQQGVPATNEQAPEVAAPKLTVAEEELHKKARRFAKLLVDEIVLYNQTTVNEGRHNRDLYDRLKDDIEKSRATYEKRYAQTSVSNCGYFTQALIAGLADHNVALLGSNFPR